MLYSFDLNEKEWFCCVLLQVTITPDWQVSDPDAGDIVKFTDIQVNDKGYFQIDEDTGNVCVHPTSGSQTLN